MSWKPMGDSTVFQSNIGSFLFFVTHVLPITSLSDQVVLVAQTSMETVSRAVIVSSQSNFRVTISQFHNFLG